MPQPAVARYWAIVVVKPPELEKIATDPLSSDSSGWSPPSAPPMRTRFHESATPRQLPPMMSMPFACAIARISRASCTAIFSVMMTIFCRPVVDPDELGDAVAHPGRRQVDDAGGEGEPGVEPLAHVVEDRDVADRRLQHLPAAPRRGAEDDVAAGEGVADRRHLPALAAQDVQHANPVLARGDRLRATGCRGSRESPRCPCDTCPSLPSGRGA